MKTLLSPGFVLIVLAVATAGAIAISRQMADRTVLRAQLAAARFDADALSAVRTENQRLRAEQIPAEELRRLREDHAALPRLRAELEALQKAAVK